jgi:hypothetical protein
LCQSVAHVETIVYLWAINEQQHTMNRQPLTNERLLEMLKEEIAKVGIGVWSDRRKTIEEMLRMRGISPQS